jgi:hypothetical protein
MRVPSAGELLDIWERGQRQSLPERMLALLGAARAGDGAPAALAVGQRDALLLELRERLFGRQLAFVTGCPNCAAALESEFAIDDIRLGAGEDAEFAVEVLDYRARFRLPDSADLLALIAGGGTRDTLLARCLSDIRAPGGAVLRAEELPAPVTAGIVARMAAADPQADVELALSCPACGHGWPAVFDIAGFLWKELHAWAKLMLGDVHELARAYGWAEADILALSPTRRQIYLELARQ